VRETILYFAVDSTRISLATRSRRRFVCPLRIFLPQLQETLLQRFGPPLTIKRGRALCLCRGGTDVEQIWSALKAIKSKKSA
jgi:hypothetical protein